MKKLILFILLLSSQLAVKAQPLITRNGYISFFSKTPLEDIKAENKQVNAVMDLSKKKIAFLLLMKGFLFEKALMQDDKPYLNLKSRTIYTSQLLIARKFNTNLSLQLTPSWIHFNLVPEPQDHNDVFAMGLGGRMKLSNRISINAEYNYLPGNQVVSTTVYNSLSMGVDIETGGHVFQLIFSNSEGMNPPYYLAKTRGSWGKGDIYFGFNITRDFNLKRSK